MSGIRGRSVLQSARMASLSAIISPSTTCTRCPLPHRIVVSGPSLVRPLASSSRAHEPHASSKKSQGTPSKPFVRRGTLVPNAFEVPERPSVTPRHGQKMNSARSADTLQASRNNVPNQSDVQRANPLHRTGPSRSIPQLEARSTPITSMTIEGAQGNDLTHPSRHLGALSLLSNLPAMPILQHTGKKRIVGWSRGDYAQLLPAIHGTKSITVNTPYGPFRASPASLLPAPKPPPFPPQFIRKRPHDKLVTLMIVATKAKISKLATKRNQTVRNFHWAVDFVVNRGAGLREDENGWDLVSPDMVYSIMLHPAALGAKVEDMVPHIVTALRGLKRMNEKSSFPRARR